MKLSSAAWTHRNWVNQRISTTGEKLTEGDRAMQRRSTALWAPLACVCFSVSSAGHGLTTIALWMIWWGCSESWCRPSFSFWRCWHSQWPCSSWRIRSRSWRSPGESSVSWGCFRSIVSGALQALCELRRRGQCKYVLLLLLESMRWYSYLKPEIYTHKI